MFLNLFKLIINSELSGKRTVILFSLIYKFIDYTNENYNGEHFRSIVLLTQQMLL